MAVAWSYNGAPPLPAEEAEGTVPHPSSNRYMNPTGENNA
uniref:Uncharacterized protein n=1 Tax=Medicago truncatula TaxID=3880 RepID=Q2HTK1_MEDTR|nr:hypothetical protein MtrDRAFT_AC150440g10v2 [Medicago truncatula]